MAILNVTSDSFYDGGRYASVDKAVQRAWEVLDEGADLLDVGGESTRPGSKGVTETQELAAVVPIIEALCSDSRPYPLPISVDTSRAGVAEAALRAGARIVNDVSGGLREPRILEVAAERGAAVVLMHMRGTPRTMQDNVEYEDLTREVIAHLRRCCDSATAAGVPPERQAVDPGIGFGKGAEACLELISRVGEFTVLDRPVLVGASRKSFLGKLFGHKQQDRLEGSVVVAAAAVERGASIVRVHDVASTRRAVDVAAALRAGSS